MLQSPGLLSWLAPAITGETVLWQRPGLRNGEPRSKRSWLPAAATLPEKDPPPRQQGFRSGRPWTSPAYKS